MSGKPADSAAARRYRDKKIATAFGGDRSAYNKHSRERFVKNRFNGDKAAFNKWKRDRLREDTDARARYRKAALARRDKLHADPVALEAERKRVREGKMRVYRSSAIEREKYRDRSLRRKYKIGIDDFQRMLVSQNGVCAICRCKNNQIGKSLHIDHDHASGLIRGLLCHGCNTGIGNLKDSAATLRAAADYLERSTPWPAL